MKMRILTLVAVMALFATVASAQWKFGGGLSMGTKISVNDDYEETMGFGVNVRADYAINDKISATPGFTFWFPSAPGDASITMWKLSADGHYNFISDDSKKVYGLAGLGYNSIKVEDFSDSEIGLNIGAGGNMGKFFAELAYNTAWDGEIEVTVGILFGGE